MVQHCRVESIVGRRVYLGDHSSEKEQQGRLSLDDMYEPQNEFHDARRRVRQHTKAPRTTARAAAAAKASAATPTNSIAVRGGRELRIALRHRFRLSYLEPEGAPVSPPTGASSLLQT
jgi:hypothetical protein